MIKKILQSKIDKIEDKALIERIDKELHLANYHNIEEEFVALYELMKILREQNIPSYLRANTSNCYITYMLGISNFNPLDFNLSYENFFGEELEFSQIHRSQRTFTITVPNNCFDEVVEMLKTNRLLKNKNIKTSEYSFGIGKISVEKIEMPKEIPGYYNKVNFDLLEQFIINEYSGGNTEYNYENIKTKIFGEYYRKTTKLNDHIKLFGLLHSTWKYKNKIEEVKKLNLSFSCVPVFYDDVYDLIVDNNHTIQKAWKYADYIHWGKGFPKDEDINITQSLLQWCNDAKYMFPRAHVIEYFIYEYRINSKKN